MQCRRHGLCRVGDMAPICQHVGRFGGKKSPTRRRHYQPSPAKRGTRCVIFGVGISDDEEPRKVRVPALVKEGKATTLEKVA